MEGVDRSARLGRASCFSSCPTSCYSPAFLLFLARVLWRARSLPQPLPDDRKNREIERTDY